MTTIPSTKQTMIVTGELKISNEMGEFNETNGKITFVDAEVQKGQIRSFTTSGQQYSALLVDSSGLRQIAFRTAVDQGPPQIGGSNKNFMSYIDDLGLHTKYLIIEPMDGSEIYGRPLLYGIRESTDGSPEIHSFLGWLKQDNIKPNEELSLGIGSATFGYKYGDLGYVGMFDGTNNIRAINWTANGNVGIGTDMPFTKLHVDGDCIVTGPLYGNGIYASTISAQTYENLPPANVDPITLDPANGFVGINKLDPAYTLDVNGDAHVTGFTTLNGVVATDLMASGNITGDTIDAQTSLNTQEINCLGTVFCDTVSAQHYLNLPPGDVLPITLDKTNNRVGINITTPLNTFDVNGDGRFRGALNLQDRIIQDTTKTAALGSTTVTNLHLRAGGSSDANNLFYLSQSGNYMYIDAKSQTGSLSAAGLALRTSAAGSNVMSEALRLEGDMTARLNGNIVQSTTKTATLGGTSTTFLNTGSIRVNSLGSIISTNGSPEGVTTAGVGSLYLRGDGADGTTLYTKVSGTGNTGWKPVMTNVLPITLDKTNNRVGINQTSPTQALDVTGSITASGSVVATTSLESYGELTVDGPSYLTDVLLNSVQVNQQSKILSGLGTPEAAVAGPVGSLFLRGDGASGTTLYTKATGTGNTGWEVVGGTPNLLPITLDKTNNRVGINKTTPTQALDVTGSVNVSGSLKAVAGIQTDGSVYAVAGLETESDLIVGGTTTMRNPLLISTGHINVNSKCDIYANTGTPEAVVTAPVGSLYMRSDGAAGTTLYTKETGTGNTGWKAVGGGGSSTPIVYNSSGDVGCPLIPAGSSGGTFYNIRSQSLQAGMYRLSLSGTLSGGNVVSVYFGTVVGAGTILFQTQSAALTRGAVNGYLTTDGSPRFGSINMLFNVSTTPTDLNFGFQLVSNTTPEIPANTFKINYYYVIEKIA